MNGYRGPAAIGASVNCIELQIRTCQMEILDAFAARGRAIVGNHGSIARAAALGLAAAGQWAANWLITVTFPGLREHLGLAYGFYGLCAILSGIFVWKWVMETKGVSLEDMHGDILSAAKPA